MIQINSQHAIPKSFKVSMAIALGMSLGVSAGTNIHIKKVVLFDYSVTDGHTASRQYLRLALKQLASEHGFQMQMTREATDITAENLASAQLIIFSNGDGDVLPEGASRKAVENFVQVDGKGILLVHAAASFINDWKFLADCAVQQYYRHNNASVLASFYADSGVPDDLGHGIKNLETKNIFKGLPRNVRIREEYYSFRASPRATPGVNVLFSVDEKSFSEKVAAATGDHPMVWSRKMGNGIALTHTMGHTKASFFGQDSVGMRMLWNEMRYAAKDFMGCMDTAYAEYNPEATVPTLTSGDRQNPCLSPTPIHQVGNIHGLTILALPSYGIRVRINDPGVHRIRVLDVKGKQIFSSSATGPGNKVDILRLEKSAYVVEIMSPKNRKTVKMIDLH